MLMPGSVVGVAYVVPPGIEEHSLYQDWSNKTMSQVLASKSDLLTALGSVQANADNVGIFGYLMSLYNVVEILGA